MTLTPQKARGTGRVRSAWSWRGRKAAPLAGALALAAAIAACSSAASTTAASSGGSSGGSAGAQGATIAFIPGETTDAFFISMHQGVADEAKKLGLKVLYQGSSTYSPTAQIPVVQSMLAEHPKALLIASTDVQALAAPIQQYKAAGIPVITLDSTISDTKLLAARITSDNTQGGSAAADALAKLAHDHGQVAIISQIPGISTTDARAAGFRAELKKYPGMSLIATEYDNGSITQAASEAQSLMAAHPGLVGIFGANDFAAEGAGDAVTSGHKTGKVFVAGYDAEPKEVQYVKSGVISLLVVQRPYTEGQLGVQFAHDILTGKAHMVPAFTALTNVVATRQNVGSPQVAPYLYSSTFTG
jgi:ribose transport system substrate-binding protein